MLGLPLGWIVAGVLALACGGYVLHCEHVKKDREELISRLRHEAEEQEKKNKQRAAEDKANKEATDAETQRNLDSLHRTIARLRDDRNRAGSLPPATANASRPDLACFDRAELARAVDNLEAGVEGLIGEGAEATVALDAAKGWALRLSTSLGAQDAK